MQCQSGVAVGGVVFCAAIDVVSSAIARRTAKRNIELLWLAIILDLVVGAVGACMFLTRQNC